MRCLYCDDWVLSTVGRDGVARRRFCEGTNCKTYWNREQARIRALNDDIVTAGVVTN